MTTSLLYVGSFRRDYYDARLVSAFESIGLNVQTFAWKRYFSNFDYANTVQALFYGFQNRYKIGPAVTRLNRDLVALADTLQPRYIFINRGLHILPSSLSDIAIKCSSTKLIGYNNDSPFSKLHPWWLFKQHIQSIKHYDNFFCYRDSDKPMFQAHGCIHTEVLPPYYVAADNYKVKDAPKIFDVSFIGHFENDGRDSTIKHLINNNVKINLRGTDWQRSSVYRDITSSTGDILPIYGKDYNLQINQSKICLVFLSRINSDKYTRRCFEIPAAGSFMLSEYTPEIDDWFKEGVEAEYFRSEEELLDKVQFYLMNEACREKIANAGNKKLLSMRQEITDRARFIINTVRI